MGIVGTWAVWAHIESPYFHRIIHSDSLVSDRVRSTTVSRSFSHSVRRSPSYVRSSRSNIRFEYSCSIPVGFVHLFLKAYRVTQLTRSVSFDSLDRFAAASPSCSRPRVTDTQLCAFAFFSMLDHFRYLYYRDQIFLLERIFFCEVTPRRYSSRYKFDLTIILRFSTENFIYRFKNLRLVCKSEHLYDSLL